MSKCQYTPVCPICDRRHRLQRAFLVDDVSVRQSPVLAYRCRGRWRIHCAHQNGLQTGGTK
jgi:hypothetical protein